LLDLPLALDYALNPDRGLLAYSDYPLIFDADSVQRLEESGQPVTLYVHDLAAGSTETIAVSAADAFHPRWLDATTLEFDDLAGEGRTVHSIP
jgi:hypothetical protein